jgi:hypothetical protein
MKFIASEPACVQIPGIMAVRDADSDDDVAARAILLRETVRPDMNQRQFAAWLGVGYQRWNNVENGGALGRDLAAILVKRIPGLTLDWLYLGRISGLHFELAQRLSEAEGKGTRTG